MMASVRRPDYRYQYLFENAFDAILIFEPESEVVLDANTQACKLYGFERNELVGTSLKQLTKDVAQGEALIQDLLHKGPVCAFESHQYRKDGQELILTINLSLIDFNGTPAILSIIRDISDRKHAEDALDKSEANLQTIFENTDIGFVLMSDTFHIKSFNMPASLFFFRKQEKTLQKEAQIFHFYPSEHIAGLRLMLRAVLEGKVMTYERNLYRSEKEEYWYAIKFTPVFNRNQVVSGVVMMIENITERKQYEIALQRSLKEISDYKFALDQSAIVSITNPSGVITYVNKNFCKISQFSESELLGASHNIVNSAYHSRAFFREMWRTISSGNIWKGEIKNKAKDGSYYWVDNTIVPFLDTLGRPYQYISIRTEITERKNAELELDKSYRLVSDQNKRLLNFSYIVSHNLRSHASNIKTILRFLQEAESPEEQKMMLQHLETVSERLDETLHNLNEVVSIQRTDQLQLESLNLCEYIEKTCMLLKDQISAKSALIQNRVPADTRVAYNAAYLESILFNLISNAIKYSHPERQSLIQIEWLVHETEKVLQVSDNGVGIDMDKFGDKLFGMYKTFHGNADAKGLGLFIAKNQVEAMGGTISVESAVNQGSVFRVHFPEE